MQASTADLRIQKPIDGLFPKSSRRSGFQSGPANTATVPTEASRLARGGGSKHEENSENSAVRSQRGSGSIGDLIIMQRKLPDWTV